MLKKNVVNNLSNESVNSKNLSTSNNKYSYENRDIYIIPNFEGLLYEYADDPLIALENFSSVLIKQKPNLLNAITGCQSSNRFHVIGKTNENQLKYLFKCKEYTSCFIKNFCNVNNRSFKMKIKHIANEYDFVEDFDDNSFISLIREHKYNFSCENRPEMKIFLDKDNIFLGSVIQRFKFCVSNFEIYDKNGLLVFIIKEKCFKCNFINSGNKYQQLNDIIFEKNNKNNNKENIGKIIKEKNNCKKFCCSINNIEIIFPEKISAEDKLLIICAGLMIDYQFFDNKKT